MEAILQFSAQYEIVIYVILGIAGIIYFGKLVQAWREWHNTLFGLERENSQRRLNTALAVVVLLALLMLVEFVLVTFVAPAAPLQKEVLATPTLDILATQTATLPGELAPAETPTPEGTVQPNAAALPSSAEGCQTGVLEWVNPVDGMEVSGEVTLQATILVPTLGFYKYEYSQVGSEDWQSIAAGNQPVADGGEIGIWNVEQLTPGDYLLRLVVVDVNNQALPPCQIGVRVVAE